MPTDPEDAKIERMEDELQESAKNLFSHAPNPGPIPEVLRRGPKAAAPAGKGGSDTAGMAKAWAIALDFVFTILACAGLGWLFDRWRSSSPTGLLVGLGLGFVFAFWRIIRATQRQQQADDARRRGGGS